MSEVALQTDPRPRVTQTAEGPRIAGWRCGCCVYPLALPAPWCPRCRRGLRETMFGPRGIVWSSTVLWVPLPGRTPPMALVYVDIDDGPRVLGHLARGQSERLVAGQVVTLVGSTSQGDLCFAAESPEVQGARD